MNEDEQRDRDTLALLKKEYQLYKDMWGLNLKYSHDAGESKNYSKILIFRIIFLRLSLSCQDSPWAPDGSHLLWQLNIWRSWKGRKGEKISFVNCNAFWLVGRGKKEKGMRKCRILFMEIQWVLIKGDPGWRSGSDRRYDGSFHWLLDPQWHRDSLLCCQTLFINDKVSKEEKP